MSMRENSSDPWVSILSIRFRPTNPVAPVIKQQRDDDSSDDAADDGNRCGAQVLLLLLILPVLPVNGMFLLT